MGDSDRTLVTGASGFLGGHVARALARRGDQLRVLLRATSDPSGIVALDCERVEGDLRDPEAVRRAVRGCRRIFHVAADYRLWSRRPRDLYETNVDGARNLFQAARDEGVERVVHTSTVGTIRLPPNGEPGDESGEADEAAMGGHYKLSKFRAERVALDFARRGLPVVIVNPTAPVGEADLKPTPTGAMLLDFLSGRMPAYLDTGLNFVDARDIAAGHLLADERGAPGERYILGSRNMTLLAFFEVLGRVSGRRPPRLRLPHSVAWTFGLVENGLARISGRRPRAPLEALRMARRRMFVKIEKAERELGFHPGPIEPAIERAVEWFHRNRRC